MEYIITSSRCLVRSLITLAQPTADIGKYWESFSLWPSTNSSTSASTPQVSQICSSGWRKMTTKAENRRVQDSLAHIPQRPHKHLRYQDWQTEGTHREDEGSCQKPKLVQYERTLRASRHLAPDALELEGRRLARDGRRQGSSATHHWTLGTFHQNHLTQIKVSRTIL